MADSEQRCELLSRLNQNLADELGKVLDELSALKRTVVDSHSLVIQTPSALTKKDKVSSSEASDSDAMVVPSFLRVMQAEQSLFENFVYEDDDA